MKCFLFLILFACSIISTAQIIENPVFDRTDQPLFNVDKVELTQDSTIVFCTLSVKEGMWANISPDTYIENTLTAEKYKIVTCNGLPFAPKEKKFLSIEKCKIRMSFPFCGSPGKINLIENPSEKSFNIYGISLKDCYEKDVLEDRIDYVSLFSLKANNCFDEGDYEKAAQYEEKSIRIKKRWYGKQSEEYENSLFMLGIYYFCSMHFDKALPCFEEDVHLRLLLYGKENELYSAALMCLAACHENLNMTSKAILLYEEALQIQEKVSGKFNSDYARIIGLLAQSYNTIGDIPKAIKAAEEAVNIKRNVLGTKDEDYLISLLNLAQYNMWINLNKSEDMLINIVDTIKVNYGKDFHLYIVATNLLSQCCMLLKKTENAILWAKENAETSLSVFGEQSIQYSLSMSTLSEIYEVMHDYDKAIDCGMKSIEFVRSKIRAIQLSKILYSIATCYGKKKEYGNALHFSNESICVFKNMIFSDFNKLTSEQKYSLWQNIHRIYDSGYPLYVANSKCETGIIELYNNALFFKEITSSNKIYGRYTWEDIQNSLRNNEIAIEFVQSYEGNTIHYYALTIKRGYKYPKMYRLLDTLQWDKLIKDRDENIISPNKMLCRLGEYIWGTLKEELNGVDNVYFSPTSTFNTLGIEYLPIGEHEYYSEKYNFYRLSTTAKIINRLSSCSYSRAYLFGGLEYSEASDLKEYDNGNRSGFDFLANTYEEVLQIANIMKAKDISSRIFSGGEGTEAKFQLLEKEKFELLHLATHGETVDIGNVNKKREFDNLLFLQNRSEIGSFVYKDDVMSWSYLVMSGGNGLVNRNEIPNGTEDGILTSMEISKMKFQHLDMVVLSACKTALGFFGADDSVLGLQQGFKMAGAETILMSNMQVDDEATRILMVEFYKNLMSGKTKHQSLRDAQQYLRKVDNGKYDDPKYWASFIMLDGLN